MTYRLSPYGGVIRNDGALIPVNPDNADWRAFQDWVAAGNTPDPALPIVVPPRTATAKQLRYALSDMGKLAAWDAAVAAASSSTRIYWAHEADPPETNGKMKRLAAASGVDLAALYDLALTL